MTNRQQQQNLSQSRDGGYTIIESLVAMIVVSVLMIAIAPVMAFSVATRVQARRMELATQAARGYIDALRTGALKSTDTKRFPAKDTSSPPDVAAAPTNLTDLYCVDFDEKAGCTGSKDFRVQGVWRSISATTNQAAEAAGYHLTVRVYRADASNGNLITTGQSIVGAGLGNPNAPLVVMSTEIPPSPEGGGQSYTSLCARLKNGTKGCQ